MEIAIVRHDRPTDCGLLAVPKRATSLYTYRIALESLATGNPSFFQKQCNTRTKQTHVLQRQNLCIEGTPRRLRELHRYATIGLT